MSESDRKFWPFQPRASVISTVGLLVGLVLLLAILRATLGWPNEKVEKTAIIGVLLLSLLPILLALFDVFIERGGVIEYGGMKIAFSQVSHMGMSSITVPVNISTRSEPLNSSSTPEILDALRQAATCDVVIIDLEEGQAWWETRLLILLAGAKRRGKPEKVVFVGTDAGKEKCFQGWAHPSDLLPPLTKAHPQYLRSLKAAGAADRQWELVEPVNPVDPANPGAAPGAPPWMQAGLAKQYSWIAFDQATGLPNKLFAEQVLAYDLAEKVERKEEPRKISLVRLEELFRPVLIKDRIDQSWSAERQVSTFLDSDAPYIAVTQNGNFVTLVSRMAVFNEIFSSMIEKKQPT